MAGSGPAAGTDAGSEVQSVPTAPASEGCADKTAQEKDGGSHEENRALKFISLRGQTAHQQKSFNSMCRADVSSTCIYRKLICSLQRCQEQLVEGAQRCLPCLPLLTGSSGNHTMLPRTTPAPAQITHLNANPYTIITNTMVIHL